MHMIIGHSKRFASSLHSPLLSFELAARPFTKVYLAPNSNDFSRPPRTRGGQHDIGHDAEPTGNDAATTAAAAATTTTAAIVSSDIIRRWLSERATPITIAN